MVMRFLTLTLSMPHSKSLKEPELPIEDYWDNVDWHFVNNQPQALRLSSGYILQEEAFHFVVCFYTLYTSKKD